MPLISLPRLVWIGLFTFFASQPCCLRAQPGEYPVLKEQTAFEAMIDGRSHTLETMLYRPSAPGRHPLIVFSHGRNGPGPQTDTNIVFGYRELCETLAREGYVVAYVIRRGYGNSEGPDRELQPTAVLSGLEAAKDYKAAVEHWGSREFVQRDRLLLMGQSQGGWAVLACTNVPMANVLGVVNISGGTNFGLMSDSTFNYNHWVAGSTELGRGALVPSMWIYSENDKSIPGPTARRMFEAYTAAGGEASLLMLNPFRQNGHDIVGSPQLFLPEMRAFFRTIGFSVKPLRPAQVPVPPGDTATRIVNLSTRGVVAPGQNALIAGFVVAGTEPKTLLVVASGLNLSQRFGIRGAIARPHLAVYRSQGGRSSMVAQNSRWQLEEAALAPVIRQVFAQPLSVSPDVGYGDAALIVTVEPGSTYSAVVTPDPQSANQDGVGLVELYDCTPNSASRLVNISSRGLTSPGERQMIVGVVLQGGTGSRLMIRGIGPALRPFGIEDPLHDPTQVLFAMSGGQARQVATNDDWWHSAAADETVALMPKVGAFGLPDSSADSILLQRLEPGAYTCVINGTGDGEGVVLTEIYEVTDR